MKKNLKHPFLHEELKTFRSKFEEDFKSKVPLLDVILKYIIKTKGKQMRPQFVITSALMFGTINDIVYRAASFIELLHTATLVHDDVVDDAELRRGNFSINALWKNKIAVLVGDYLLSKGLLLALDNNDFEILKIVSNAVKSMSEGELLQIEKARRLDIKEEIYFDIISAKTASLLAAACAAGSYATSKDITIKNKMHDFGNLLGIAFQIKDDLLDYGKNDIGKPKGIDIKEKKMTLPLIYTLNKLDKKTRSHIIYLFKNKSKDQESIDYIIETVSKTGGLEYAQNKMVDYYKDALSILEEFPESNAKDYMKNLAKQSINREK